MNDFSSCMYQRTSTKLPADLITSQEAEEEVGNVNKILQESFFVTSSVGFGADMLENRVFVFLEEMFDTDNLSIIRRQLLALVRKVHLAFFMLMIFFCCIQLGKLTLDP